MKERVKKANKTYCDGHDQEGVKVCSWEKMPGWQKFLKGEITETELSDQAKEELSELDQAFGKYLRNEEDKDHPEPAKDGPLEEPAAGWVGRMLVEGDDIRAGPGQRGRDARDDAGTVLPVDDQASFVSGAPVTGRGMRVSRERDRCRHRLGPPVR